MSSHTADFQTIEYEGNPAFVLVPFDIFRKTRPMLDKESVKGGIPHEIVKRNTLDDVSMIKAWREYLGFTQQELPNKVGITQPAIAKLECHASSPRRKMLKKIAEAMEIRIEQLEE